MSLADRRGDVGKCSFYVITRALSLCGWVQCLPGMMWSRNSQVVASSLGCKSGTGIRLAWTSQSSGGADARVKTSILQRTLPGPARRALRLGPRTAMRLEAVARLGVAWLFQVALEAEVTEFLGRPPTPAAISAATKGCAKATLRSRPRPPRVRLRSSRRSREATWRPSPPGCSGSA